MSDLSSPLSSSNESVAPVLPSASTPLTGKTVLVTRSAGQSNQFTQLLQQQGATVLEMPTIEIGPPSTWAPLDQAIAHLHQFDWLILTSANGVEYFFERLAAQGKGVADLGDLRIAVVGQKTAKTLQHHGRQPDFIPPDFVADALVIHFPERDRLPQLNLLFPRVETGGRDVLVKEFSAQGATVTEVPAYESGCAQAIAPEVQNALNQGRIDIVTFASSKTAQCFHRLLSTQPFLPTASASEAPVHRLLNRVCLASIGPQTSSACVQLFGRVDVEATEYTLEGLTQAIVQWAATQADGHR